MLNYIERAREIIREMTVEEFQEMINSEWFKNKTKQSGDVKIVIDNKSYAIYNEETGLFRLKTPNFEYQYFWCSRGGYIPSYPDFLRNLTKDYYCYSKLCATVKKDFNIKKTIISIKKELKKHLVENYGLKTVIKSEFVRLYFKKLTELKVRDDLSYEFFYEKLSEILYEDIQYKTYNAPQTEKDIFETMKDFVGDWEIENYFVYESSSKHRECIEYFEKLKKIL